MEEYIYEGSQKTESEDEKFIQCMSFGTVVELNLFLSNERDIEYIDIKTYGGALILVHKTKL